MLNYFSSNPADLKDWVKINTASGETVLVHPRSGVVREMHYVHNYDINTCVRNQQDYTLGFFEWAEEGIESENVWRGGREGETIWLSCIYFSVMWEDCSEPFLHAYDFVGWSQRDIKDPDTEGEGLVLFRGLRRNGVVIKVLNICIINDMWREQSWVCLHEKKKESVFGHDVCVLQWWDRSAQLFRH